ncbi:HAD family hydrolase [Lysobacter humi (ex Lee et al. 2017)]
MTSRAPALVLFDLDGVLVEYDRARRVRYLAQATGAPEPVVHQALFDSGLEARFDAGTVSTARYLAMLGEAIGRPVDVALWAAARGAAMRLSDDTVSLVTQVASVRDVALLTNNGCLLVEQLPRLLPPLAALFGEHALCSASLGRVKPDPAVYALALARLGHVAEDALFLDDAPANVDGARRAGLRAEHVASPAQLREVLARHLPL